MTERVIERRIDYEAPIERVWKAIADPAELTRWFGDEADLTFVAGTEGALVWHSHGRFAVRVDEVAPPHRLVWSWMHEPDVPFTADAATTVEWTLEPREGGGTTLHLRESGFRTDKHYEENDRGWTAELGELTQLLAAAA